MDKVEKNITNRDMYQLMFFDGEKNNHAGFKAPQDVRSIMAGMGFEEIDINVSYRATDNGILAGIRYLRAIFQCFDIFRKIKKNSVVFIQTPTGGGAVRDYVLKKLKEKKEVRIITLFHDIEALRGLENKGEDTFFKRILQLSDGIIVHNSRMRDWFISQKIFSGKIVCLDVFDYLFTPMKRERKLLRQVIIAGNLSPDKVKYIAKIRDVGSAFILYGPNYDEMTAGDNMTYKGSFSPDELPHILEDGFGLIWDGDSVETCSGMFGQYLRYNNPHKLSLYLASGLPVFIWKEAAEAEFVEKNGVGYTISSLHDIASILDSITDDEYKALCERVNRISSELVSGTYTKRAVTELLSEIE